MPVYMIRSGERGPVKIGHTTEPYERLAALQTGHFDQLSIIRLLDGCMADERQLHRRFSELRLRGEWFSFCPSMMEDVGLTELPVLKKERCVAVTRDELRNYAASRGMSILAAYRDAHNLTASEMGRMLDVEHSTVLRIEQGKREPSAEMLRRIVRVTNGAVTADDVLGIKGNAA